MWFCKRIPFLLCALVIFLECPLYAQERYAGLRALVSRGQGTINNLSQVDFRQDILIEVRDENNNPVAGATLALTVRDGEASGVFSNGEKFLITHTSEEGRAETQFLPDPGDGEGLVRISVTVSHSGYEPVTVEIRQTNKFSGQVNIGKQGPKGPKGPKKWLFIAGAAAAAAAVYSVAGTGDPPPPLPPPLVGIGFGGPPSIGPRP